MTEERLTKLDVESLKKDDDGRTRIETASKLSRQFNQESLSKEQRVLAEEIFRLMVKDAEVRVREALSKNLKENPNLPHDVAFSLANDVDSVSLPVIQYSDVLSNEDLIKIVNSQSEDKQKAVASRSVLDETVSEALVEKGSEEVVAVLVSNEGADINEKSFEKVIQKYGDSEIVQKPLVDRSSLPITVAESLVVKVSEELQKKLMANHELSDSVATDIIMQTRERATIMLSTESSEENVKDLVKQLKDNKRLTPSIILRALCMGDLTFFEYSMAVYSDITIDKARLLIHDSGPLGLKKLYEAAKQPMAFYPAVRIAVDATEEMEYDGEDKDRERYSRKMIERILTQYDSMGIVFENDDIEYLLTKMNQLPPSLENADFLPEE